MQELTLKLPVRYYRRGGVDWRTGRLDAKSAGEFVKEITLTTKNTAITIMHGAVREFGRPGRSGLENYFSDWRSRQSEVIEQHIAPLFQKARKAGIRILYNMAGYERIHAHPNYTMINNLAIRALADKPDTVQGPPDAAFGYCADKAKDLWRDSVGCSASELSGYFTATQYPESISPRPEDWVAEETVQSAAVFREHGIGNLLMTGFDACGCLMTTAGGLLHMAPLGYRCVIVEDCVEAAEAPWTREGKRVKACMLKTMQLFGMCGIIHSNAILKALEDAGKPGERTI